MKRCVKELTEIKEACRHASLKVIWRPVHYKNVKNIHDAAILALYSGADFLKTIHPERISRGFP
jgi:deoxyribose-phosphate aldolase